MTAHSRTAKSFLAGLASLVHVRPSNAAKEQRRNGLPGLRITPARCICVSGMGRKGECTYIIADQAACLRIQIGSGYTSSGHLLFLKT